MPEAFVEGDGCVSFSKLIFDPLNKPLGIL